VRVRLLSADTFDPGDEAVIRFVAGMARSRRAVRGLLDKRASAVRVVLDADQDGRLGYAIELPGHARGALRTALGAYPHVEAHDETMTDGCPPGAVARAELTLARPSTEPLRAGGVGSRRRGQGFWTLFRTPRPKPAANAPPDLAAPQRKRPRYDQRGVRGLNP
jgi:hypothetical protein